MYFPSHRLIQSEVESTIIVVITYFSVRDNTYEYQISLSVEAKQQTIWDMF